MIYVLLEGHEMKQDLRELFRIFFPNKEINYIESIKEYKGKGILIKSILYKDNKKTYTKIELYKDNILLRKAIENMEAIEIYRKSDKKNISVGMKKTLTQVLDSEKSKIPWGILTGIRPVKIIHDLIDKNINNEEIIRVMTEEYKLELDKAKLILEIGKRQREYIYPLDKDRYSIYISIPFCPTRCLYCSFPSLPIKKYRENIKGYVDTLIYEIQSIAKLMRDKKLNTVYIGGGTPTAIPPEELERIIQIIYDEFGEKNIKEFTVEAGRPDTMTKEYLQMLNKNKIQRISINPQTMNNKTLKTIGRNHTSEDIIRSFNIAKDIGFESINMDLIIGLPGEEVENVKNTLNQIKKLDPENLTVHTLSVKRGSEFRNTMDEYPLKTQDTLSNMLNETFDFTKNIGLEPYYLYRQKQTLGNLENIGYSKLGKECIYNIAMMEEKETIIGAGMGSVSKIYNPENNKIERIPNFKGLRDYMERIEELINKKKEALDS